MNPHPQRIVCLSAESADWLWRIGAWDHVVGVTAYFEQPTNASPKPKISGFSSANHGAIEELHPDLVITFSDVQAGLAESLIKRGFPVHATNQRTLSEINQTLATLARIVGCENSGDQLLTEFCERIAPAPEPAVRPRVYFEEWNDPFVSGIAWVSELIESAGGIDVFSNLRTQRSARDREVTTEEIVRAKPDIIFASWCGNPVNIDEIISRPGWDQIPAVQNGRIHEIPSADILQPGFRLTRGYDILKPQISSFGKAASAD